MRRLSPAAIAAIHRYPFWKRLGLFLIILAVLWLPFVGLFHWLLSDPNTISIIVMTILFTEFLVLLRWWGRGVYQWSAPLHRYGLQLTRANGGDLLRGLAIAFLSLWGLFWLEGLLGWLTWNPVSWLTLRFSLEGLAIALGVGLGEELIFRGWLLTELQQDYHPLVCLWSSSLVFAILHYLRPVDVILETLPQFFGLWLLGIVLVWATWQRGRLGLPIGIHAGLVWGYYIVEVGGLVDYTGQVPAWVTGLNGNPLAGVMGLIFLGGIGVWVRF
jgi:hypothetical protein